MQCNIIFFIAVKAVHVSGGFPAHHQELKNCTYSVWYLLSLVAAKQPQFLQVIFCYCHIFGVYN